MHKVLIIFGPPGAGKGTQAMLISENYKLLHISTGDILRSAVKDGTELGKLAKSYMDSGELVPDKVVIGIIKEKIENTDSNNGLLLDGFPRTIPQAEELGKMLHEAGLKVDSVISIEVPDEEIVKRIDGRRVCQNCGAMYHILFDPPSATDHCDKCDGKLYQRDDDKEEVIRTRLRVYRRQTEPLKIYYKDLGLLSEVNGLGTVGEVSFKIRGILNQL